MTDYFLIKILGTIRIGLSVVINSTENRNLQYRTCHLILVFETIISRTAIFIVLQYHNGLSEW